MVFISRPGRAGLGSRDATHPLQENDQDCVMLDRRDEDSSAPVLLMFAQA